MPPADASSLVNATPRSTQGGRGRENGQINFYYFWMQGDIKMNDMSKNQRTAFVIFRNITFLRQTIERLGRTIEQCSRAGNVSDYRISREAAGNGLSQLKVTAHERRTQSDLITPYVATAGRLLNALRAVATAPSLPLSEVLGRFSPRDVRVTRATCDLVCQSFCARENTYNRVMRENTPMIEFIFATLLSARDAPLGVFIR